MLYPKKKSPPVVNIRCSYTKDKKEIQEEGNRLYQRIRHQTKPITGNNIPGIFLQTITCISFCLKECEEHKHLKRRHIIDSSTLRPSCCQNNPTSPGIFGRTQPLWIYHWHSAPSCEGGLDLKASPHHF